MIIDYTHPRYQTENKRNGAYFYAYEIKKNIIPKIKTDRNWVLLNINGIAADHSIVFIHNNLNPERYSWLSAYDDLILICGIPETCEKVKHLGTAIYLPLSVDVEYVRQFRRKKDKDAVFAGRKDKVNLGRLPEGIDYLFDLPRHMLLHELARYRTAFTVGRTAIEAKILDCEIGIYDNRFPTDRWDILDNADAAKILQLRLNEIDGVKK